MKPLSTIFIDRRTIAALILALIGTGCRPGTQSSIVEAELPAPSFSQKSGLFLPEATKRSLDLKLVEITEQKIETAIPLSLRVYQTGADKVFATGLLTSAQTRHFKVGQSIEAKLSDNTMLTGKVAAVRTELQSTTGSHELLVEFSSTTPGLVIGGFLTATARIAPNASVVTIPRRALLENSEGQFAYTVSGDHFVRTAIKTDAGNDEFIEVTDGLYAGDQVVLQPVMSLWMTELAAVKGGQACCVMPPKGK